MSRTLAIPGSSGGYFSPCPRPASPARSVARSSGAAKATSRPAPGSVRPGLLRRPPARPGYGHAESTFTIGGIPYGPDVVHVRPDQAPDLLAMDSQARLNDQVWAPRQMLPQPS